MPSTRRRLTVFSVAAVALTIAAVGLAPSGAGAYTPSPSTPAAQHGLRPCRAGDLTLVDIFSDGAMGHIGYRVTVMNTSGRACALLGSPARVVYQDAAGRTVPLPTVRSKREAPDGPALAPGARAEMALFLVNGYGGYDPSNPACAHPALYQNLSARFRGGLLPLDDLVIDLKCGDITAYDWFAAQT